MQPKTYQWKDKPKYTFLTDTAIKHDGSKPKLDLLPFRAINEVGEVLTFGAQKYDAHNWRQGFAYGRLVAAALRHIFSWTNGEDLDPETNKSHLAHAACCILFLLELVITNTGTDDRYVYGDKNE